MLQLKAQTLIILLLMSLLTLFSCSSNSKDKLSEEEKKARIYFSYGTNALISKDYTTALDNFLKCAKINDQDSLLQNNLGMTYYFKGRNDLAIDHLEKAIDLDPKNSDARNNLASIYYTQKKYTEAKEQFNLVLANLVYKHQYRTQYNLGLIAIKENEFELAKVHFGKSIDLNP